MLKNTIGTTIAANHPKEEIGVMSLMVQDANVMVEVSEVTNIALDAFLHARLILRMGCLLIA